MESFPPSITSPISPSNNIIEMHLEHVGLGEAAENKHENKKKKPRFYSVAVYERGELSPEDMYVKPLTPVGPFFLDMVAAPLGVIGMTPAVRFCLLKVETSLADDVSDPLAGFVAEKKGENISQFHDFVVCYLGKSGREKAQAKYLAMVKDAKSREVVNNSDSIRIWNMLTLREKIVEALEKKGLIEAPMFFHPPLSQDVLPTPPPILTL